MCPWSRAFGDFPSPFLSWRRAEFQPQGFPVIHPYVVAAAIPQLLRGELNVVKRLRKAEARSILATGCEFEGLVAGRKRHRAEVEFLPNIGCRILIPSGPNIGAIDRKLHDASSGVPLRGHLDIVHSRSWNTESDGDAISRFGSIQGGSRPARESYP